jgi:hypothetical protein
MNHTIQTMLTCAIGLIALVHVFKGKSKKSCCTKASQNQQNNLKQSQPIFFVKKHK